MPLFGSRNTSRTQAVETAAWITRFAPIYYGNLLEPIGIAPRVFWFDEYVLGFVSGCAIGTALLSGLKKDAGLIVADVLELHSKLPRDEVIDFHDQMQSVYPDTFHSAQFKGISYAAYALGHGPDLYSFIQAEIAEVQRQVRSGQIWKEFAAMSPAESCHLNDDDMFAAALLNCLFMDKVGDRLLKVSDDTVDQDEGS